MAVSKYTRQEIYEGTESYRNLEQIMKKNSCHKILVVCGGSFKRSLLPDFFAEKGMEYCVYNGFQPNPTYENVLDGLHIFRENHCDFLISIGGGSAIDVAKCIKAYANMDDSLEYIDQSIKDSGIMHLAMPTTAGTGSESTHFAVIYHKGRKISVSDTCLLPEYVILEPLLLATLPDYQKKATLMDALCQATESYWSVNADRESRAYAKEAITLILRYAKPYIRANENLIEIFHAANLAGRAINITQTTLAHAMSYKLTSMYGISHGHAVALCMPYVWEYLAAHTDCLQEGHTEEFLKQTLLEINSIYHCKSTEETIAFFRGMMADFGLNAPNFNPEDVDILTESVNEQRMKNFPALIKKNALSEMYQHILTDRDKLTIQNQLHYNVACDMRELETFPETKQYKMLGLKVRESSEKLRIEAAGTLIEAILAFEKAEMQNAPALGKIISELAIALNGYVLTNEVDSINYRNASAELKKFLIPVSEKEKEQANILKNRHPISTEHGLVLSRFVELTKKFQDIHAPISNVFGVKDTESNINILRGMLCQFGLLLEKEDHFNLLNYPENHINAHGMILLWENAKARLYNRKFNHYLKELRKVQLEMMDEIARVCDENNLTYVLNYGSLLGAVRHKGFIPWDDDLDICMPREDYERFLEIGKKELKNGCYLYNNRDFHDCWFSMMKVMKRDTVFVRHPYRFGEEDGQRIFIDVWPLDNVMGPEEEAVRKMKKKKSVLTRMLRLKIKTRTKGELSNTQKLRTLLLKPVSEKWLIRKRNQIMTQWRDKETDYWISGGVYDYIKETMPKSWYLPATLLPFEGHEYKFPGNYTEVLQHFYGNYMQIPPVDKRYTHAPFKVQMEKGGEIMYFNETQRRRRRSLRSKILRKGKKMLRTVSTFTDPFFQYANAAIIAVTGIFRRITPNGRKLLSYKDKYSGQTCCVIENSSFLTEEEKEKIKQSITFVGDNCYGIAGDKKWRPDFYCISETPRKNQGLPPSVRNPKRTRIFYTAPASKGRKQQLKSGIRIASRKAGKMPVAVGKMEKSYYDNGSGNFIFLLETAIYMGFKEIIVVGCDHSYSTYHMHHFAETEKLAPADREYETYQLRAARYAEIVQKMDGICQIREYGSI